MKYVIMVVIGYLACSVFRSGWLKQLRADRAEMHRWRVNAEEARRWLAEFPDVAIALDHVMRCAAGVENPAFIADVRQAMRARRAPLATQAPAAREFGVAYQHLSAECCSDDTPSKPSRWDGAMRGL